MSESHDIEQIARVKARLIVETLFDTPPEKWHPEMRELAEAMDKAFLPLLASAREEGARDMRERAAKAVGPSGERPCDCDYCRCGNSGDAASVTMWDADALSAKVVRALPPIKEG